MNVIKRDGSEELFDRKKISAAIKRANKEALPNNQLEERYIDQVILPNILFNIKALGHTPNVEEIQDTVEDALIKSSSTDVAKKYIRYRYERELARGTSPLEARVLSIIEYENEEVKQENSNKNPEIVSTQRDYMAGEISRQICNKYVFPKHLSKAHEDGLIHIHDTDYISQRIHNCDLVNLEDMLQNGTVISDTRIDKPHMFSTACNIATQVVAQVASSQFGGQTITASHLAPFVEESRKHFRKLYAEFVNKMNPLDFDLLIEELTHEDIVRGVQTIQYQVITLMTTNGQAPFVTFYLDINEVDDEHTRKDLAAIIEEVLRQRIQGVKNDKGVYVTPAFPKLIYALDDNNAYESSEYYYLTKLAAECTAKRLVPDYISRKKMRELKGDVYPCMGCRSFLTPDPVNHKYYGRFNQGVVTINLVDIALSSKKDMNKFWEIFDERLEMCHEALRIRHERLRGTPSDVAPILWQHGALARLKSGETIDELLYNNYSTISLGYGGLYECVKYMTGESHTHGGKQFALRVMKTLNEYCDKWKADENISYSLYGTPMESTTYKFAKCLQKRFGIIEDITDHGYITNSYHVNVREPINIFEKFLFESEFQELSPGGAISYGEVPNMQNNIPAVISVIQFIYENIMYAELNTKSDYCSVCGYDGEIVIESSEQEKLIWKCPNCGNMDQHKLHVARRTCGYIGTNFWNQGRTEQIKDRVLHM